MDSFYNQIELSKIGFNSVGKNVLISKKCSIYNPENITIGDNVRIDDFCILSGKICLGNYIHIAASSVLFGGIEGIIIKDYSCLSSRCAIYAITDDYSGNYMTNPMVPDKFRNVVYKEVIIGKHVVIGSGSTVLPGVHIADGVSIGSMTLVNKDLNEIAIYVGVPAKKLKDRSRNIFNLENKLLNELEKNK